MIGLIYIPCVCARARAYINPRRKQALLHLGNHASEPGFEWDITVANPRIQGPEAALLWAQASLHLDGWYLDTLYAPWPGPSLPLTIFWFLGMWKGQGASKGPQALSPPDSCRGCVLWLGSPVPGPVWQTKVSQASSSSEGRDSWAKLVQVPSAAREGP